MTDKPKKLSDMVRMLLTAAARRNDHLIAPPIYRFSAQMESQRLTCFILPPSNSGTEACSI
jgi:hypothetical protein